MRRKSDHTGILRRGSACLSCRRRKLRCDGGRPVCTPCSSMRRTHECKYDDSGRKSRTQTLREKLSALEAKVRELESGPTHSPPPGTISSLWPKPFNDVLLDTQISIPQLDSSLWEGSSSDPFHGTSLSFDYGFDVSFDFAPGSSPSHSDVSMSRTLGIAIPTNLNRPPLTFTDSSGTPIQDGISERFLNEPNRLPSDLSLDRIQSFIMHRKQCCFYSNPSRFDPSASPTVYQNTPPNPALMSAIYLLGSFFARVTGMEQQLLEQTLHEVSRSLHNQEQPVDMVQALCLLAQYFIFNNRDMEGNRHLSAARRIAIDLGLHQASPATFPFELEYAFDTASQHWLEKSAIYWQMFMVNNFWSANNDCCVASPTLDAPCRHITTPLPVEEGVQLVTGNSAIHTLFDADEFRPKGLSVTAFKVMASSIFDRSLRVHNTILKDNGTWTYRRSAEVALERLSALVHPATMRDSSFTEKPFVDTDLFAVQSLIVASTIHLHLDSTMDLKISQAANNVVELVNQLSDDDYQFLDPVLSVRKPYPFLYLLFLVMGRLMLI
ncbi:hypothetical protein BDZ97DRAFT_1673611 [Flammula alnicola]|nr:hypothetical protein BDZ97DRAFT_1673611 [Flammula alnicola]